MNIAIVDDEEAFRNTLTEFLKRFFVKINNMRRGFLSRNFMTARNFCRDIRHALILFF